MENTTAAILAGLGTMLVVAAVVAGLVLAMFVVVAVLAGLVWLAYRLADRS